MKNRLRVQNFQEILAGGGQPVYLYHMGPSTARTPFGDPGLSLISGHDSARQGPNGPGVGASDHQPSEVGKIQGLSLVLLETLDQNL